MDGQLYAYSNRTVLNNFFDFDKRGKYLNAYTLIIGKKYRYL